MRQSNHNGVWKSIELNNNGYRIQTKHIHGYS